jgi:aspartyl-tRNA(Asn)/glutamyl-tRNA(Gln) amidotransferase subunit A
VLARIVRGAEISGPDYVDLMAARASLIARAAVLTAPFDAVAMPTVAVTAPTIEALTDDDEYVRTNAAILRNPLGGQLHRPLRAHAPVSRARRRAGRPDPYGEYLGDRRLISIGLSCEAALRRK